MRKYSSLLAVAVLVALVSKPVQADIIVNATQVGGNVVFSGGGFADLAGLSFFSPAIGQNVVIPNIGAYNNGGNLDIYSGISVGPSNFGTGGGTSANETTGDRFGIAGSAAWLLVPGGYVSGGAFSGTSTFNNHTFASLGLTPGSYVWTWGNNPQGPGAGSSFTLNIGPTAIPEPGTMGLCGAIFAGFVGFSLIRRRRKQSTA